MAMIVLVILTSLMLVFAVLSQSEPTIAANHVRSAQARALAESGVEQALWALSHPTHPAGIPYPPPATPLPSPTYDAYNGRRFTRLSSLGGFRLTVTPQSTPNLVDIVAVGWAPTDVGDSTRGHKRIDATATRVRPLDPPCAFCALGTIARSVSNRVDASGDTTCGDKWAVAAYGGGATVDCCDGLVSPLSPPGVGGLPVSDSRPFHLTRTDRDTLKSLARANGTYFRGAITFASSNPITKNGILFIDTASGRSIEDGTPTSEFARVRVEAGAFPNGFKGWIVANGDLEISGNFGGIKGTVYAVNELAMGDFGGSTLSGVAIAELLRGGVARLGPDSRLAYHCADANGAGAVPMHWFLVPGGYQEVAG